MKRDLYKNFKQTAIDNGINSVAWAGFAWINLTEKQLLEMITAAENQGLKPDEDGYFVLENGLRFRNEGGNK